MAQTRVGVRTPGVWKDLLVYYRADGTPNDIISGKNLTLVNGTTYGTGKINQGFQFDGVNDYAEYNGDIGITGDFTVSGWVYRNNIGTSCFVQSKNFASLANGSIGISFVSRVAYVFMKDNSGNLYSQNTYNVLDPGSWYHLVITFNNTTKKSQMYWNGSLDPLSNTTTFTNCNPNDFINGFRISNRLGQYLSGSMDELGIWNRILTPTEVTELYNSGNGKQK